MNSSAGITTHVTHEHRESFICWKSAFAGLFISFFAFIGLLALGMAFGGSGLEDGTTLGNAGRFAGIWFLASVVIALLAGSFFSARSARRAHAHIGAAQGLLVAALFFGILLYQTASTIGWVGRAAGSTVAGTATAVSTGIGAAAQSPVVQEIVEDSLGDLKISPERAQVIVTGVARRLVNGRPDSARNYLSAQTGITQAEAEQRLATLKAQAEQAAVQTREATATALKATGWTLFLTLVLGAIAGAVGGGFASHLNLKRPFYEFEEDHKNARMNPRPV